MLAHLDLQLSFQTFYLGPYFRGIITVHRPATLSHDAHARLSNIAITTSFEVYLVVKVEVYECGRRLVACDIFQGFFTPFIDFYDGSK